MGPEVNNFKQIQFQSGRSLRSHLPHYTEKEKDLIITG